MIDYQDLFISLPASYVIIEPNYPEFTVVAVTDAYLRTVNLKREDMVGRALFAPFTTHNGEISEDAAKLLSSLRTVVYEKRENDQTLLKHDVKVDNGIQTRYWTSKNIPLFDNNGNIKLIVHAPMEITHLINLGLFKN